MSAPNEGSSVCKHLEAMQDTGPQIPHSLISYKKYSVLKDENDLPRPWDGRLGHLLL